MSVLVFIILTNPVIIIYIMLTYLWTWPCMETTVIPKQKCQMITCFLEHVIMPVFQCEHTKGCVTLRGVKEGDFHSAILSVPPIHLPPRDRLSLRFQDIPGGPSSFLFQPIHEIWAASLRQDDVQQLLTSFSTNTWITSAKMKSELKLGWNELNGKEKSLWYMQWEVRASFF